jgi:hypothetical protein
MGFFLMGRIEMWIKRVLNRQIIGLFRNTLQKSHYIDFGIEELGE